MTVTEFLLARIAEDEASAPFIFSEQFTPARVLAECEAKRLIVALLEDADTPSMHVDAWLVAKAACHILAAVYVEHADYDETWRH